MITDITIDAVDILTAAQILSRKNGYEDISVELITKVLSSHIEELIDEMLNDPEHFFNTDYQLWKKIDKEAIKAESEDLEIAA